MSDDWRDKAERDAQEQLRQERQRVAQREAEEQRREDAKLERENRDYARKLATHQQRFRCHIGGEPSDRPASKFLYQHTVPSEDRWSDSVQMEKVYATDWGTPTGLQRCPVCDKWTCPSHLTRTSAGTICEKDVRDGYKPGQRRSWWTELFGP